jgi:U3 small nucleolar RNA-associated protein 21
VDENGHSGVWVFKRGKKVGELQMPADVAEQITQLLVFGSWIVGYGSSRLEVWKSETYEHYTTLVPVRTSRSGSASILIGGVCNMPTFLNKIFVAKRDGGVDIWNVSTG